MMRFPTWLLWSVLAACGGAKPSAPPPAAHTAADLGPLCLQHYAHEQRCADDYLGALLDLRISVDMPKGIADEAKAKGKPALVELARVELARDLAPEKVDAICKAMATQTPPDQVQHLVTDGQRCAAAPSCKEFAACAVETERTYVLSGAQH
jgi:hypothetical protein